MGIEEQMAAQFAAKNKGVEQPPLGDVVENTPIEKAQEDTPPPITTVPLGEDTKGAGVTHTTEPTTSAELPFADPLAVHISAMRANGATGEEVRKFVELQTNDYAAMEPMDVMKRFYKVRFPEMSDTAIENHLSASFGEYEDKDSADYLRITQECESAREYLIRHQAESLNNSAIVRQAKENTQRFLQSWAMQAEGIAASLGEVDFSVKDDQFSWEMKFRIPDGDKQQIKELVYATIQQKGLQPTSDNVKAITEQVLGVAKAYYASQHTAALIKDAYEKGKADAIKSTVGLGSRTTPTPNSGGEDKLAKLKAAANPFV